MIQWSRHLRHKFLPCIYIVEWSLSNLPTTDNIATNFAEEWRFHINNWYVVLKIEESKIHLFERTTKWPDLWSQTMRSFIPKRIVSYIIKPHPPPPPSILGSRSDQKVLVIIIIHFIHNIIYKKLLTIILIIIIIILLLLLIIVVTA